MSRTEYTGFFKALADENRLKIMDMLSGREICACEILCELEIKQSTLSHHMKILCGCSLVNARRDKKWTYYSLNNEAIKKMKAFMNTITARKESNKKEGCICNTVKGCCE